MPNYQKELEFVMGTPFTHGNAVRLLENGDQIFPAMLGAIDRAESTIDFATFVYWRGEIADQFAHALAKKAQRNVTVRVLLDAFGARLIRRELVEEMETAGVEVRWFRPLSTWRVWRSDKRTHRKLLVCDSEVGFTGGVGIADEWAGDARNPDEWRDIHVEVKGPALFGLRAAFVDNWNEAGAWLQESAPDYPVEQPQGVPVQVIRSSTTTEWTDIASLIRTLVLIAEKEIQIITAYFAPEPKLVNLLCDAAKRGIEVTVLVAGEYTDSRLTQLAGQVSYQVLLNAGVRIYRYQKTMLHTKAMLIDQEVCCIGSANINYRSLSKDEECCAVVISRSLASDILASFTEDIRDSESLTAWRWASRGKLIQLKEKLARILVEQL